MKTSKDGLAIIKQYEGFRSKPYLCPAHVPTIGYGATYYPDGKKVTLNDPEVTEAYAEQILMKMLEYYEEGVNRYVQKKITQPQFDALVSFSYNLGLGALKSSTLLRKLNVNPSDPSIKTEFKKWVKANGRVLAGLVKRRGEEAELYFS